MKRIAWWGLGVREVGPQAVWEGTWWGTEAGFETRAEWERKAVLCLGYDSPLSERIRTACPKP